MNIFLSAGEESGDVYWYPVGKYLLNEEITGYGGKRIKSLHPNVKLYQKTDVSGLFLPLRTMFNIAYEFKRRRKEAERSDIFVGIGLSEFNFLMGISLKNKVKKRVCYLPPQLWAWAKKRGYLIKKAYDVIITVFPFEYEWYRNFGFKNIFYFGNPLCNTLYKYKKEVKKRENTFIIFAGSRKNEIKLSKNFIEEFIKKFKLFKKNIQFFYALPYNRSYNIKGAEPISGDKKYKVLSEAWFALVYPGTAALEVALLGVPHAIFLPHKPWWGRFLKLKTLSIAGLVLNRAMFEFIEPSIEVLIKEIQIIAEKDYFFKKIKKDLWNTLYNKDACKKIANCILNTLTNSAEKI